MLRNFSHSFELVKWFRRFVPHLSEMAEPLNLNSKIIYGYWSIQWNFSKTERYIHFKTYFMYVYLMMHHIMLSVVSLHKLIKSEPRLLSMVPWPWQNSTMLQHYWIKREALSVHAFIEMFRLYLFCQKFVITFYHRTLLSFFDGKHQAPSDNCHLLRYCDKMQEYDFEILYFLEKERSC